MQCARQRKIWRRKESKRKRVAYQRVIKHKQGQPTAYVAALYFFSACVTVGRLELVSQRVCKAHPGRKKERASKKKKKSRPDYLCEDRTRTLFLPLFSSSPFLNVRGQTESTRRRKRKRRWFIGCTNGFTDLFLSHSLFVQIVKNIIIYAWLEQKNIIHYSGGYTKRTTRGARMGESRPPPREEKGLKMTKGREIVLARQGLSANSGRKKLYFILSCFSREYGSQRQTFCDSFCVVHDIIYGLF